MKLATKDLVFPGLNEGELVDFSRVDTVEQLKETIINNYVTLCRKCASESFCKFYDHSEPPCPILKRCVNNYVDMNVKSINTENQYNLSEFIKSVILLTRIFNTFENWRGIYVDEIFNWYFESMHPSLNLTNAHNLLVEISKFIRAYRVVKIDRLKKFVVFVEGDTEYEALPRIFDALGVLGIGFKIKNSVDFINLEGKDRFKRDKIGTILRKLREDGVTYFLILDNDQNVKGYIEDLKKERLIEDTHCLIWRNKFEDNFGEEFIVNALKEEVPEIFNKINISKFAEELRVYNSGRRDIGRSVEYLLREEGATGFCFKDYKVRIAKKAAELVCREIDESQQTSPGTHDRFQIPTSRSFPEFVEKLRKLAEEMKRASSEFHVIKD